MSLIIEDPEVERLAAEVAAVTGETETDVVRRAMMDPRQSLEERGDLPKTDAQATWSENTISSRAGTITGGYTLRVSSSERLRRLL